MNTKWTQVKDYNNMLWEQMGYKSLKESFEEKTNTSIFVQESSKYLEKIKDSNNDTPEDQLNNELNHFINTSIIAERA